ncbi:N-ethylammeline chlorohydrolase [compost metagenome]
MSTLVYATQSRDVIHVFVGGRQVVRNRELQTLDSERVVARAREQIKRLRGRAGV